jgi:hypothetical protein
MINARRFRSSAAAFAGIVALALLLPRTAAAHCDSMDGPVVKAAIAALEAGDPALVLPWVRAADEAEVRDAFVRTLRVRATGDEARELADRWFFETVVRLHRLGEGESFTGLKPGGWKPPAVITAADRALGDGSIDELATALADDVLAELVARHRAALALRDFAPANVAAGRRYVAAYVAYMHLVEGLYHQLHGSGHDAHDR